MFVIIDRIRELSVSCQASARLMQADVCAGVHNVK